MKPLIARVLLATDFSGCAAAALEHAVALASSWKAELHILHVVEFLPGMNPAYPVNHLYLDHARKEAVHQVDEIRARAADAGLAVGVTVDVGIPSQCIGATAAQVAADIIVMGTHGRTGLEHVVMGSTAERVVRTATRPVYCVKARKDEHPSAAQGAGKLQIRRLLIPIDFFRSSMEALEYSVHFAKHVGAAVALLHTLEPVAYGLDFTLGHAEEWRKHKTEMQQRLDVLCALCAANGIKASASLKAGLPIDSIGDCVSRQRPDLLVMGTHGRRGLSHFLSGSVAEAMLRFAPCPVLTVRTPVFDMEHERIMPATEAQLTPS